MGVYIKDASGKRIKVAGGGSGAVGPSGQDGKSAYDYAVAGGYTRTEAAFQALMGSAPWVPEAGYVPASNPNLLDNWYFPDPINQRRIQSGVTWGSKVYGLDRWKSYAADATKWVENEGIYLLGVENAILEQSIETNRFGGQRQITFSALIGTKLLSFTQDYQAGGSFDAPVEGSRYALAAPAPSDGLKMFRVYRSSLDGETVPVIAAKVELGDKQTLARKDADGNWVLNNPPPNRATELEKCQRYQLMMSYNFGNIGVGFAKTATTADVIVPLPISMRYIGATIPATFNGLYLTGAYHFGSNSIPVSNITEARVSENTVRLSCDCAGELTPGHSVTLQIRGNGWIIFDANL